METNPEKETSKEPDVEQPNQEPGQPDNQITINADDYKASQRRISNLEKKLESTQGSNVEPSKPSNDDTVSKAEYNELKKRLDKITNQQNLNNSKESIMKTAAADKISLSDEDISFIVVQGDEERTKKNYEYVKSFKLQPTNTKTDDPEPKKAAPKAPKREGEIDFGAQLAKKTQTHDLSKWL